MTPQITFAFGQDGSGTQPFLRTHVWPNQQRRETTSLMHQVTVPARCMTAFPYCKDQKRMQGVLEHPNCPDVDTMLYRAGGRDAVAAIAGVIVTTGWRGSEELIERGYASKLPHRSSKHQKTVKLPSSMNVNLFRSISATEYEEVGRVRAILLS